MQRMLIGVDEAGRGPLAGPVAVGAVAVPHHFDFALLAGVRDSKQMSELGREIWFEKLQILTQENKVRYIVQFSSVALIDRWGIMRAILRAVHRSVRLLAPSDSEGSIQNVKIILDGLLTAPKEYKQETIIRGDESEPLIALASIAAKVRRDRLMRKLALRYPEYGFEAHKGYGTKAHYDALKKHGPSAIHRRSFL